MGENPGPGRMQLSVATAMAGMEVANDVVVEVREVRSQHTGSGTAGL